MIKMPAYIKYNIYPGQVYIAADGTHHGCVILDVQAYKDVADVIILPFDQVSWLEQKRYDAFKLSYRYMLVRSYLDLPKWTEYLQQPN